MQSQFKFNQLFQYRSYVVVIFLSLLLGFWVDNMQPPAIDSVVVAEGANEAIQCLEGGYLYNCNGQGTNISAGTDKMRVGNFPAFQYLPSVVLVLFGTTLPQTITGLTLISTLSFFGTLILMLLVCSRLNYSGFKPIFLLLIITGPVLFYANTPFGEMLATFLLMLFVTALVLKKHWLLLLFTAFLASLTKETAAPLIFLLGVVLLFAYRSKKTNDARTQFLGLFLGTAFGLLASILFNVFRFGQASNVVYDLAYKNNLHTLNQTVINFFAELFSPNGGLFIFWPVAVYIIIISAIIAFRKHLNDSRRIKLCTLGLFLVITILLVGFASWPAPFGWVAWGTRLVLPWIPALVLSFIYVSRASMYDLVKPIMRNNAMFYIVAVILSILSLAQLGALWAHPQIFYESFGPGTPQCQPAPIKPECLNYVFWIKTDWLANAYSGFTSPLSWILGTTMVLSIVIIFKDIRIKYFKIKNISRTQFNSDT